MADDVELVAKLKLDTSEAEKQLSSLGSRGGSAPKIELPKDTEVSLPQGAMDALQQTFAGPKGLGNLAKLAKGATQGFKGLGDALGNVVGILGTKTAGLIGLIIALVSLLIKMMQGTDSWKAVTERFTAFVDKVKDVLAPSFALIGESLMNIIDILSAVLLPLFDIAADLSKMSLQPLVFLLKLLKPLFDIIGKLLEVIQAISSVFTDTAMGIMTSLMDIILELVNVAIKPLLDVLDKVIEFIERIKVAIQDFITKITGGLIKFDKQSIASTAGKQVPDEEKIKTSLDTWETSGQETEAERQARLSAEAAASAAEAANASKESMAGLGDIFRGIGETFVKSAKEAWEKISQIATNVWSGIKTLATNVWNGVKTVAGDVWSWIKTTAGNVWSGIKTVAGNTWDWIETTAGNVWNGIKTTATNVWNGLKSTATNVWYSIESIAGDVWSSVSSWASSAWSSVETTASNVWSSIETTASDVWSSTESWARDAWSSAKSWASDAFSTVETLATNVWDSIKTTANDVWWEVAYAAESVWDGVKDTASTVWQELANAASAIGNFASNVWEGVKDAAGNVGSSISGFFSKLKFWDSGGTLDAGAQIWGMNEKGNPEFLFNAGGHDSVINADILSDAVYAAMVKAGGTSKGGKLEVSVKEGVQAGPRELVQWLLPSLKFLLRG